MNYTGTHCECHIIGFLITLQSVPKSVLDQFGSNPDWATSATAIKYVRDALYNSSISSTSAQNKNLFSSIQILTMSLTETTPPQLKLTGNISDNCELDLSNNNYGELQLKWIKFLGLVKQKGLAIGQETIPVDSVTYEAPDLKCDQTFDQGCTFPFFPLPQWS